jgi:hypothetical protein
MAQCVLPETIRALLYIWDIRRSFFLVNKSRMKAVLFAYHLTTLYTGCTELLAIGTDGLVELTRMI